MAATNNGETVGLKLQDPGAGLPWWEALAAKYLVFPWLCWKWTWATASRHFQDEGARVLAVWDEIPAERLQERVLVRRITGMEDSSRHWSAAMAVEHLTMVGSAIRGTIDLLRRGQTPPMTPRIADFKPKGAGAPADVKSQFVQMLAEEAASTKSEAPVPRGQGPRYVHPWFGPIDAHHWQCLLAFHQSIHRKQIEAIRNGLVGGK